MAVSQDCRQILFRSRFNINIRRPANPQRRVFGQRFVAANHRCRRDALRQLVIRLRSACTALLQHGIVPIQAPLPSGAAVLRNRLSCAGLQSAGLRVGPEALDCSRVSAVREPGDAAGWRIGATILRLPRLPTRDQHGFGNLFRRVRRVPLREGAPASSRAPPASQSGPTAIAPAFPAWRSSAPASERRRWLRKRGHCETGDCPWLPDRGRARPARAWPRVQRARTRPRDRRPPSPRPAPTPSRQRTDARPPSASTPRKPGSLSPRRGAGQMEPLPLGRAAGEQRQGLEHQLVDPAGALAAAHYEQDGARRIKA